MDYAAALQAQIPQALLHGIKEVQSAVHYLRKGDRQMKHKESRKETHKGNDKNGKRSKERR